MYASRPPRAASAALSLGITGLGLAILIWGIGIALPIPAEVPALATFAIDEPAPTPTPTPSPRAEKRDDRKAAPKDEAGERNLRNVATPVVAPPVEPLIVLPPIVAAPLPETGSAAQTGASDILGSGRGAGNRGDGRGGGGLGGEGDGTGGGPAVVGPRRISGTLSYRDLPDGVLTDYGRIEVVVVFAVLPNGRVDDCEAELTSGSTKLDEHACRLIEQRFRYRPARDSEGRNVRAWVRETHGWVARPQ